MSEGFGFDLLLPQNKVSFAERRIMEKILSTKQGKVLLISLLVLLTTFCCTVFIISGGWEAAREQEKDTAWTEEQAEAVNYMKAGVYATAAAYESGIISAADVTVENAVFTTLEIAKEVGDGSVTLKNVRVKDALVINGGGQHSVKIEESDITVVVVNDEDCRVLVTEGSRVSELIALSSNRIDVYGTAEVVEILPAAAEVSANQNSGVNVYPGGSIDRLSTGGGVTVNVAGGTVNSRTALTQDAVDSIGKMAADLTARAMQGEDMPNARLAEVTSEALPQEEEEENVTTVEEAETEEETEGTSKPKPTPQLPAPQSQTNPEETTGEELTWDNIDPDTVDWTKVPVTIEESETTSAEDQITYIPNTVSTDTSTSGMTKPGDEEQSVIVASGITAIGDSVMLGAKDNLEGQISGIYVDAKESRQVWNAKSIISDLESQGKLYQKVVIGLGTNSPFAKETGQAVIDAIGDRTIFWVNTSGESWMNDVNSVISSLCSSNSNVFLIDWAQTAAGHSEWFYDDGIHLRPEGRTAYANLIARHVN